MNPALDMTYQERVNHALDNWPANKPKRDPDPFSYPHDSVYRDYSKGSTHPACFGDADLCPDFGCKACQYPTYDNRIRGRIKR